MYDKSEDVYVKYAQDSDITIADDIRRREGAQTTSASRSATPSVISMIAAFIEVVLLIGAAVVIWTNNLLVTADGVINPLNGNITESFSLIGNFGDIVVYLIGMVRDIGQSFSDGTALVTVIKASPILLFWLGIVLTAAVLPAIALVSFLITLLNIGRRPMNFPRSFAVLTSLCLADILLSFFMGIRKMSIFSSPLICALLGLIGIAVSCLVRALNNGHKPTAFSFVRFLGGIGLLCGCALTFFSFPIIFTTDGTTALSALLTAINEPSALSVALSAAAALCTLLSLVTLPIFIYRAVVRLSGGKGRIVGRSGAFLITALLTSFVIGAYAYMILPSAEMQTSVYFYAAGGIMCFLSSLILGSGRVEK